MSNARPSKRKRAYGTSYHDAVPLDDDYNQIQAREGRLRRVGSGFRTAPEQRSSLVANLTWDTMSSWTPPDDTEYALDLNGDLFDELLEANVMESTSPLPQPKKKKRSKVSVSFCFAIAEFVR